MSSSVSTIRPMALKCSKITMLKLAIWIMTPLGDVGEPVSVVEISMTEKGDFANPACATVYE